MKYLRCPDCNKEYLAITGKRDPKVLQVADSYVAWCPCGTVFVVNPSEQAGPFAVYCFRDTDVTV